MDITYINGLIELAGFVKLNTPDPEVKSVILAHMLSIGRRLEYHFKHKGEFDVIQETRSGFYIDDDVEHDRPGFSFMYLLPKGEKTGLFLVTDKEKIVDFYPLSEETEEQFNQTN